MQSSASSSHGSPVARRQTPIQVDIRVQPRLDMLGSASQSLTSDASSFEEENGRTYHGRFGGSGQPMRTHHPGRYRAGSMWFFRRPAFLTYLQTAYLFPNDSTEADRLDHQYEILKRTFHGKNYFAPLSNPERILDIGTGTGKWAIEMGDDFPKAEIQATDLSPIQPSNVPANVHFFIDDASEEDWAVPPAHFDYIHTRVLLGCFTDFRETIRKAFFYTKPGGYVESQEIMSTPYCDDGSMPDDWVFLEWSRFSESAAVAAGRPLQIADKLKRWYEEVGFVDVQERVFRLPMNPWPRDPHLKALGRMSECNWLAGLSGLSMAYFCRVLNWTKPQIEACRAPTSAQIMELMDLTGVPRQRPPSSV
ncbi:hypothetical protein JHW43_007877 [Diplocarpon mali]|nr:hypothetical protein JHW43_007877 [Diplocarpon mali]